MKKNLHQLYPAGTQPIAIENLLGQIRKNGLLGLVARTFRLARCGWLQRGLSPEPLYATSAGQVTASARFVPILRNIRMRPGMDQNIARSCRRLEVEQSTEALWQFEDSKYSVREPRISDRGVLEHGWIPRRPSSGRRSIHAGRARLGVCSTVRAFEIGTALTSCHQSTRTQCLSESGPNFDNVTECHRFA
jgi:hypothetical protein